MYGLSGAAGGFNSPSYQLANQRQTGVAQLLQSGSNDNDQQQQQQQLNTFLQQQLWGMGLTAASTHPLLAQSLGLALQNNATSITASANSFNPNSVSLPLTAPTQQAIQGLFYPASMFVAQHAASFAVPSIVSNAPSAVSGSNNGASSDSYSQASGVHAAWHDTATRGFSLPSAAPHQDEEQPEAAAGGATGRPPVVLYISCDDDSLSQYQCLVRKQIELFAAGREDVESNAQGRNRPIVMGQVGIRCRHCTMLPPKHRARGAIYYPAKLYGIYQAAQNMAAAHLGEHCQHVPAPLRDDLTRHRDRKSSAGGGKKYWAEGVRVLGVYEDEDGLRFERR